MKRTAPAPRLPVKKRQVATSLHRRQQQQKSSAKKNSNSKPVATVRAAPNTNVQMTTTTFASIRESVGGATGVAAVGGSDNRNNATTTATGGRNGFSHPKTKSFTLVRNGVTKAAPASQKTLAMSSPPSSTKPAAFPVKDYSPKDDRQKWSASSRQGRQQLVPSMTTQAHHYHHRHQSPNQYTSWREDMMTMPDELPSSLLRSNGSIAMDLCDDADAAMFSEAARSVQHQQAEEQHKQGWPGRSSSSRHRHRGQHHHPGTFMPSPISGPVPSLASSQQPNQVLAGTAPAPPMVLLSSPPRPNNLSTSSTAATAIATNNNNNSAAVKSDDKKTSDEDGKRFRRWTPKEDKLLKLAVAKEEGPPHNWKKIATDYFHDTRRPLQCKTRWKNALSPAINRDPFSAEEDQLIIEHHKKGLRWPDMVPLLKGRTSEQIRERFVNNIDPSLKTTPWTVEEDHILSVEQNRIGNKWMEIKKYLPGRSEKSIKNRWHNRKTKQRRALRRMAAAKQFRTDLVQASKSSAPPPPPHFDFAVMSANSTSPPSMAHLVDGTSVAAHNATMMPPLSNDPPDLVSEGGMTGITTMLHVQSPPPSPWAAASVNSHNEVRDVKRRVEL